MLRFVTLAAAFVFGLNAAPALAQQQAETVEKTKHGSWSVRCLQSDSNVCGMIQVGNNAANEPLVSVELQKLDPPITREGATAVARLVITTPIGVLLPAGVSLTIDGREIGAVGYEVCYPQQCIVARPIDADLVNQMKKGSNTTVTIRNAAGQPSQATLSLSGFTKAFNSL